MSGDQAEFDQNPVPTSDEGEIPFAISMIDPDDPNESNFNPTYYPGTLTQTSNNEIERTSGQCEGETVYMKQNKNPDIHINGIVLARKISTLRKLSNHMGKVELISPLPGNGGEECVAKKVEIGEILGWDNIEREWQFDYTIDLVSTGRDSGANQEDNETVSQIING
jgi:hypothetical protein